jgi:hypothetical protein
MWENGARRGAWMGERVSGARGKRMHSWEVEDGEQSLLEKSTERKCQGSVWRKWRTRKKCQGGFVARIVKSVFTTGNIDSVGVALRPVSVGVSCNFHLH